MNYIPFHLYNANSQPPSCETLETKCSPSPSHHGTNNWEQPLGQQSRGVSTSDQGKNIFTKNLQLSQEHFPGYKRGFRPSLAGQCGQVLILLSLLPVHDHWHHHYSKKWCLIYFSRDLPSRSWAGRRRPPILFPGWPRSLWMERFLLSLSFPWMAALFVDGKVFTFTFFSMNCLTLCGLKGFYFHFLFHGWPRS